MDSIQDGSCSKMCRALCPLHPALTTDKSSKASSASKTPKQLFLCLVKEREPKARLAPRTLLNRRGVPSATQSGVMGDITNGCQRARSWAILTPSLGVSSTRRRVGESHKDGGVYLLSSILTDSVPGRFSLSPKACQGILRRAAKRGKELPEVLRLALERQANSEQ